MAEFENSLNIVCLESEAFYALVEEVVERIKDKSPTPKDKWISDEEAMKMLRISSRTTLQKMRDSGKIRFSQPTRKLILYDRGSILDYLEAHAKETF